MNKVIKGKRYDSDKAERIAQSGNGLSPATSTTIARRFAASARASSSFTSRAGRERDARSAPDLDGPAAKTSNRSPTTMRRSGLRRTWTQTGTHPCSAIRTARIPRRCRHCSASARARRRSLSARRRAPARRNRASSKNSLRRCGPHGSASRYCRPEVRTARRREGRTVEAEEMAVQMRLRETIR